MRRVERGWEGGGWGGEEEGGSRRRTAPRHMCRTYWTAYRRNKAALLVTLNRADEALSCQGRAATIEAAKPAGHDRGNASDDCDATDRAVQREGGETAAIATGAEQGAVPAAAQAAGDDGAGTEAVAVAIVGQLRNLRNAKLVTGFPPNPLGLRGPVGHMALWAAWWATPRTNSGCLLPACLPACCLSAACAVSREVAIACCASAAAPPASPPRHLCMRCPPPSRLAAHRAPDPAAAQRVRPRQRACLHLCGHWRRPAARGCRRWHPGRRDAGRGGGRSGQEPPPSLARRHLAITAGPNARAACHSPPVAPPSPPDYARSPRAAAQAGVFEMTARSQTERLARCYDAMKRHAQAAGTWGNIRWVVRTRPDIVFRSDAPSLRGRRTDTVCRCA